VTEGEAKKVVEILEEEGYEASVYEGYSGRGMYGKETWGVSTDASPESAEQTVNEVMIQEAEENDEDEPEQLEFRYDSLGKRFILY
jgi:hypothetical protein